MMEDTQVFTHLAESFISGAGSPAMVALIVVIIISLVVLAARGGKVVLLMIMVPLISTISGAGLSIYLGIPYAYNWVFIAGFDILGFIFAGIFLYIIR